jgi:hypothetical protein
MFEELYERPSRWRLFWPDVRDLSGAQDAIRFCSWLLFAASVIAVAAGVWLAMTGGSVVQGLVGAGILAVLGLGVRNRWRTAAVAGLLLIGIGIIATLANGSFPGVIDLFVAVALVGGVRGTFAHARLRRLAAKHDAQSASELTTG